MKILLDTHVLLWVLVDDVRLSDRARFLINDLDNDIYFSAINPWEVQIKHMLHPDKMKLTAEEVIFYSEKAGFASLPIRAAHTCELSHLVRKPGAKPHKDPFDRMLICQAQAEGMLLLTHDVLLAEYDAPCVMVV